MFPCFSEVSIHYSSLARLSAITNNRVRVAHTLITLREYPCAWVSYYRKKTMLVIEREGGREGERGKRERDRGRERERENFYLLLLYFWESFCNNLLGLPVPSKIHCGNHLLCVKMKSGTFYTPIKDLLYSVVGLRRLRGGSYGQWLRDVAQASRNPREVSIVHTPSFS